MIAHAMPGDKPRAAEIKSILLPDVRRSNEDNRITLIIGYLKRLFPKNLTLKSVLSNHILPFIVISILQNVSLTVSALSVLENS